MKKILSVVILVAMAVLSVVACNKQESNQPQTQSLPIPPQANNSKANPTETAKQLQLAAQANTPATAAKKTQEPVKTDKASDKAMKVASTTPVSRSGKVIRHVVTKGESLWEIAARPDVYGDAYKWPLLFRANKGKIKDPDRIGVKLVLVIDHDVSPAEIVAAVKYAKTRGDWKSKQSEKADASFLAQNFAKTPPSNA